MATAGTGDYDRWLQTIRQCKPLTEPEMKLLCERVRIP
jgi:hypothetical protein